MHHFGKYIMSQRIDHDETQEQLATLLKVNRTTIGRWERGETQIQSDVLIRLCLHWQVSSDYLLGLPYDLKRPRK